MASLPIAQPAPRRRLAFHLGALVDGPAWTVLRACTDAAVLGFACLIAGAGAPVALPLALIALAALAAQGAYERYAEPTFRRLLTSVACAAFGVLALQAIFDPSAALAPQIAGSGVFALAGLAIADSVIASARRAVRRSGEAGTPVLIVGAGRVGADLERRLLSEPEHGLVPVGFLDADPLADSGAIAPVLGSPADLERVALRTCATRVIFAFAPMPDSELYSAVRTAQSLGLAVSVVPRLYESTTMRTEQRRIAGMPLFEIHATNVDGAGFAAKHLADRVVAGIALVVLSPVLIALALAVRFTSRGPVLFRQTRIGLGGREFAMLKFRSMRPECPGDAPAAIEAGSAPGGIEGVDRRTLVGRFLRRSSLDELPQLWNVLRGEMSLVGPRPERPDWVERFAEDVHRYEDRHRVHAGLTGWAQVNGLRGQTSISDRVEHDNFYIENWSPWLDVKVLAGTASAALRGE